ncbi:hypothetical protein SCA6_008662 [Theobroma cacao]
MLLSLDQGKNHTACGSLRLAWRERNNILYGGRGFGHWEYCCSEILNSGIFVQRLYHACNIIDLNKKDSNILWQSSVPEHPCNHQTKTKRVAKPYT